MSSAEFDASRKRLWNELVALADLWTQFQHLFAGSKERVDVLNACASWFFGLTQRLFLKEILLSISRLTDPAEQRGHRNLTIRILLEDPELAGSPEVRIELEEEITRLAAACKEIREHRRKYIAHLDYAVALDDENTLLPGLAREHVSEAVESLLRIYNLHHSRIRHGHSIFDLAPNGGAEALLEALKSSERFKRWEQIQVRLGRRSDPT
jgi:hypothetical protein